MADFGSDEHPPNATETAPHSEDAPIRPAMATADGTRPAHGRRTTRRKGTKKL